MLKVFIFFISVISACLMDPEEIESASIAGLVCGSGGTICSNETCHITSISSQIIISSQSSPVNISFPGLVNVTGQIYIGFNSNVQKIYFPKLEYIGSYLQIFSNMKTPDIIHFESLAYIGDQLYLADNPDTTLLNFPNLTTVVNFVDIWSHANVLTINLKSLMATGSTFKIRTGASPLLETIMMCTSMMTTNGHSCNYPNDPDCLICQNSPGENSTCNIVCDTAGSTISPTAEPTIRPTISPTAEPTIEPTTMPTISPTAEPTTEPTTMPTIRPTAGPTTEPSLPSIIIGTTTIAESFIVEQSIDVCEGMLFIIGSLTFSSNYNTTVGSNSINVTDTVVLAGTLIIKDNVTNYPKTIPLIHASNIEGTFDDIQYVDESLESCETIMYEPQSTDTVFSVVLSLERSECTIGAIIGGTIGGIVGGTMIILIVVYVAKKQKSKYTAEATQRVRERSEQELRDLKTNLAKKYTQK